MSFGKYFSLQSVVSIFCLFFVILVCMWRWNLEIINNPFFYIACVLGFCLIASLDFWGFRACRNMKIVTLTPLISDLQSIPLTAVMLLAIFVIPIDYFAFSAILMLSTIVLTFYIQRKIVVDKRGIRLTCRWDVKWTKVASCHLNQKLGLLEVHLTDGRCKRVTKIANKHFHKIECAIAEYFKP